MKNIPEELHPQLSATVISGELKLKVALETGTFTFYLYTRIYCLIILRT